ncbi:MAG: hypothetical protein OCD76_11535 [Reichenbachiella sp.]
MLIEYEFFRDDKNYTLKTIQAFSKDQLIHEWTAQVLKAYNQQHNPIGIMDDFMLQLKDQIAVGADLLDESYDIAAAAFRLSHQDLEMELDWNAREEMDDYYLAWKSIFAAWIVELSAIQNIQRAVIKYATQGAGFNHDMLKTSVRRAILRFFKLRMRSKRLYKMSA